MTLVAFILGIMGAGVALYFILRAVLTTRKGLLSVDETKDIPTTKKENVEFVIDTFSTLINKLKEKEEELERLRSHAENRASVAEIYNEDILRSVGSGVITFNMERKITTFNHAAERILKKRRGDVLGLSCVGAFGPDNTLCILLEEAFSSGRFKSRQEVELQGKGLTNTWVGLSTSPLKDKDGKQLGIIIVFTDLTEIRMLREQGELKKRLAMLGEMSGGIAHEFRNSMGTILGFVKILSKSLKEDESAREVISTIITEINSMDLIIKELLNYGKPIAPSLAHVDLNGIVRKALDITISNSPDIKLDIDINAPDLVPVYADEVLLRQALQNIFQNAVESMPDGGSLRIEIRSQKPSVISEAGVVSAYPERGINIPKSDIRGEGVDILISDTGMGIPKDLMEKIFLPFYTTKPRGTGMGLALVHKIILAHGGTIKVESREGAGTTFKVYLPWPQSC
ncbi:MAG: hypothetical protein A2Y48_03890 [Nitrospirae bacterium RIFCSPLOW2_12_42_9]|nr:MAG: hypothetical protein A2Y48_03890 [Nitrospirae bacterium RIFCSPLOW2_12_42_9]